MIHRLRPAVLLALLSAGCPIGNNKYPKPRDLDPVWRIDKLRVLAIRAEPPEIRPGDTARFQALITDPDAQASAVVWIACPPDPDDPGGIGFGCALDAIGDPSSMTPDELAEAGFIGFEPLFPPVYTAPDDLLDELDPDEAAEGVYVLIQVAALPAEALQQDTDAADTDAAIDFNQVEVAYKRLVVSAALTPNHNPDLLGFTVDGFPLADDAVLEIDPGETYEIGALLAPGSVEVYDYVGTSGLPEERVEEPYVRWYTDGGSMLEEATLYPYLQASWQAPADELDKDGALVTAAAPTSGTIWAVVRDRRGGMGWASLRWRLRGSVDP
ncbi:MAG TPA: hypothetical protein PKA64_00595 [Myxococcota bacterium]|nr:hypothetical protein [Myxococcota bacterium]